MAYVRCQVDPWVCVWGLGDGAPLPGGIGGGGGAVWEGCGGGGGAVWLGGASTFRAKCGGAPLGPAAFGAPPLVLE